MTTTRKRGRPRKQPAPKPEPEQPEENPRTLAIESDMFWAWYEHLMDWDRTEGPTVYRFNNFDEMFAWMVGEISKHNTQFRRLIDWATSEFYSRPNLED